MKKFLVNIIVGMMIVLCLGLGACSALNSASGVGVLVNDKAPNSSATIHVGDVK